MRHQRSFRDHLGRRHGLRAALYLASQALAMELAWQVVRRQPATERRRERTHRLALPLVLAITWAFTRLRPEDRWRPQALPGFLRRALWGALLGLGVRGLIALLMARLGWLRSPGWGWEATPPRVLAWRAAQAALDHAAVALNEEIVFRGYGYETLRLGLGAAGAGGVSTALFAVFHGLEPDILLGQAAGGFEQLGLRLASDSLGVATGYHWAWNMVNAVVLTEPAVGPSLRPVTLVGPPGWVGSSTARRPGRLIPLVNLVFAAALLGWAWRRRGPGR